MRKNEGKAVDFLTSYMVFIVMIVAIGLSLYARIVVANFESGDMKVFLLPWYNIILENGGLRALNNQVGDYGILYQTLVALMTYLPVKPVYALNIFPYHLTF